MTADEVRARIRAQRNVLTGLIATIDAAALSAPGPDGGWAIQDHLVHIGAWEHWLLALFERRDRRRAGGGARGRQTAAGGHPPVCENTPPPTPAPARGSVKQPREQISWGG